MSTNSGSILIPWLFLIAWMQDPKGAASDVELANLPARHGVALSWGWPGLTVPLVHSMVPWGGREKGDDSLRKELGLRGDQLPKLTGLVTRVAEAAAAEYEKRHAPDRNDEVEEDKLLGRINEFEEAKMLEGLPDVLTKPQMIRFEELHCQIEGLAILRVPAYAIRVGLSDDQRTRIGVLIAEYQKKADDHHMAMFPLRGKDDVYRTHIEALRSLAGELDSKILPVLSARQKADWKGLVGEKFKWDEVLERDDKTDP